MNEMEYALDMAAVTGLTDSYSLIGDEDEAFAAGLRGVDFAKTMKGMIGAAKMSERSMLHFMTIASVLGVQLQGNDAASKIVRDAIAVGMLAMGGLMLYQAATTGRKALEEAYAAVEATAHAIAQDWYGLAMAAAASATVYATFEVSKNISSGDWKFNADYTQPADRRRIEVAVGGAGR